MRIMPTPSKELIQKLKDLLEKKTDKEVSWQEASEGAYNLLRFADLLVDLAIKAISATI